MEVKCNYCNSTFVKKESEAKRYKKHFCSRKHYFDWQKETLFKQRLVLECTNCGKSFKRRASAGVRSKSFCTRECQYEFHRGENAPAFKGGRLVNDRGYVMVLKPEHPRKVAGQYVYEHVLKCEDALGRHLNGKEVVHHINGVKDDNRLENLMVVDNHEHHRLLHAKNPTKTQSELIRKYKSVAEMTAPSES